MKQKPSVDDDSVNYDSDSTCPTSNTISHHKKQKQKQPLPRSRTGYFYATLHSVLLLSFGLLVSNSKITFEGYAPQPLLTSEASHHHIGRQQTQATWKFGNPTLSLNSTFPSSVWDTMLAPDDRQRHSFKISQENNTASLLFGLNSVNQSKRLEFIHITKTGGSAIEMGAAACGVQWGVCHFRRIPRLGCNSSADWAWPNDRNFPDHMANRTLCEPWHTPPHWLIPNPQPSDKVANFIVVRDPYQRVLSEYYCPSFGFKSLISRQGSLSSNATDAQMLNAWVVNKLRNDPIFHGHLMPQHYYVFHHVTGVRLVDHILRYESLDEEFNRLMKLYGVGIRLPLRRDSQSAMLVVEKGSRLSVADFSLDTIRVINEYYRLDFQLFDYKMITDQRPEEVGG